MLNNTILHPSVSSITRLLSTIPGRDKILRLLQYYSRLRIWFLVKNYDSTKSKDRWTMLAKQLVLTRKLLRAGKSLEHLQAAVRILTSTERHNRILHQMTVLHQILCATYLSLDSVTILDSLGVQHWKHAPRIRDDAARVWFSMVLCGLSTQFYCLYRMRPYREGNTASRDGKEDAYLKRTANRLQIFSGLCDLIVSSSAAKITAFDGHITGVCGMMSSMIGIYGLLKPIA